MTTAIFGDILQNSIWLISANNIYEKHGRIPFCITSYFFKEINVLLRNTRDEQVEIKICLKGQYPIDNPSFYFVGKRVPIRFEDYEYVMMPVQFTSMYPNMEGIEGCLQYISTLVKYHKVVER